MDETKLGVQWKRNFQTFKSKLEGSKQTNQAPKENLIIDNLMLEMSN